MLDAPYPAICGAPGAAEPGRATADAPTAGQRFFTEIADRPLSDLRNQPRRGGEPICGSPSFGRRPVQQPGENAGRDEGRDEVLVSGRAQGLTYEDVGKLIGRSARTARRLAADPETRRRIAERRRDIAANAAGRSTALLERAIGVHEELLDHPDPALRLRAADAALRYHFRFTAEVEVLDDIQDLQDQVDELRTEARKKAESS
jgi:hypothetical protein